MEIFMTYILPVLIFMAIGAAAGGLLVLATKFLAVKEDETVAKIAEVLPNANCGACGFAGCADYAKAVAAGTAPSNKCKPGGSDVAAKVAAIMGTEALETVKEVAFVRCNGCQGAVEDRYDFIGT
ncbi:MAG: RnfABCDGE type electron transport complex subunit B, partial [[Eubacterium] saphenum]|nr:RnfABCDGE type electron transport complex subunit B [[Eubacterium] saphenum]